MDTRSITALNLNTGELMPTGFKLQDDRFAQRGYKMYNIGIEFLVQNLSKKELLVTLSLYGSDTIDYHNLLIKPFSKLTKELDTATRSRLKKKLLELGVIGEYEGKIMLNPFMFLPKGDKNIKNSQSLTQRTWKYLFQDMNAVDEGLEAYIRHVFNIKTIKANKIKLKTGWYEAPKDAEGDIE